MRAPRKLTRPRPVAALVFALASFEGCGGRVQPYQGQLVIHVDSDAFVPPAPGSAVDPHRPPWLFDRVRFELFHAGSPAPVNGNSRDFSIDEGMFRTGSVSVGVLPDVGDATYTVRVTLFRGDRAIDGLPPQSMVLQSTASLPPVAADGLNDVTIVLHTADVGQSVGSGAPNAATLGAPSTSLIESWQAGAYQACAHAPATGQRCIPGGAYWFGDPAMRGQTEGNDIYDEALVVVSPFFLDATE
ncbi:MAG: hypothetical protein ACHREM_26440, partial [Polyangiales bacterium]